MQKACTFMDMSQHLMKANPAGLRRWTSIAVEHCRDAWALVVEHLSSWSLVYSGDTRPCKALAAAGHGCTLLIHEATFEPDLIDQVGP